MSKKKSFYEKEYHKIVGVALSGIFVIVAAQLGTTWYSWLTLDDDIDKISNIVSILKDRSDRLAGQPTYYFSDQPSYYFSDQPSYYFSEADSTDIAGL